MKKTISKILIISMILSSLSCIKVFAGTPDKSIPMIPSYTITLDTDGTCTFTPPVFVTYATISGVRTEISKWKKFEAQLLKRQNALSPTGTSIYKYTKTGSVLSCKADENEISFKFTSTGFYQVQVRGVDLAGNYAATWSCISVSPYYEGIPINEEDLSISGGNGSGSGAADTSVGPGNVQIGSLPAGYQYAVVGPNGQILYYYGGNNSYSPYYGTTGGALQYQQNGNQYLGPGYANNMQGGAQILTPNTGISNYQQVESPYTYVGTNNQNNQNNQNSTNNPNYSTGNNNYTPSNNTSGITPQITQGLEIGWHVDNNGRFYYQGNGVVLKGTWYLIDGNYFRFGDNGYLLANQWFKDSSTGYWYYLAGDGRMLTGWQCLNGVWYYFKPQNGNGYGTMYANTSLYIEDQQWGNGQYAFDANGAMVKNAWYGGHYYGNDGRRTN